MPKRNKHAQRAAEPVIDLRPPAKRALGEPAPCPECHEPGYLDRINLRLEVQLEHCPACGHEWSTSFAELAPRI